jgi:DnaK suppressor protein
VTKKAQPAKPKASAKPTAKAAASKAKSPAPKKVTTASKAAKPKTPVKPSKPAAKPVAKPAAKKATKPAAKPAAKGQSAGKPIAKPAAKPIAKAVAKPVAKKPVNKTTAKSAKPIAKTVAKTAAKAVTKAAPKAAPKAASKAVAKAPVKKPVAAKAPAKPVSKATSKAAAPAKAPTPAKATPVAKAVPPAPKAPAAKPPKPEAQVLKPGSEVIMPTVNKRAEREAMAAQMNEVVVSSLDPSAAKATFLPVQEREMTVTIPAPIKKDPKRANNWKTKPLQDLTDNDVLAMPDTEYMNDVQLAYFRLKLQELKRGILVNAGETTEHLREDTSVVPDPADRATIEEEHALELRTRDRERKLLKKIEQSIARIDSGDYGYCDETGEPIGVGRLLARPTANLSIEAQQRRELKQKMFGD